MSRQLRQNKDLLPSWSATVPDWYAEIVPCAPRWLFNLLVDRSSSMGGHAIQQVNDGMKRFKRDAFKDVLTRQRVQLQLVAFGSTVDIQEFVPITRFSPPELTACGGTPLAEAILQAIAATQRHLESLGASGDIEIRRPYYFLFSDGCPTSPPDLLQEASDRVHEAENARAAEFHAFGTDRIAVGALQPLFPRKVHLLAGCDFTKFFRILSVSVRTVSARSVSDDIDITPIIEAQLRLPYYPDSNDA